LNIDDTGEGDTDSMQISKIYLSLCERLASKIEAAVDDCLSSAPHLRLYLETSDHVAVQVCHGNAKVEGAEVDATTQPRLRRRLRVTRLRPIALASDRSSTRSPFAIKPLITPVIAAPLKPERVDSSTRETAGVICISFNTLSSVCDDFLLILGVLSRRHIATHHNRSFLPESAAALFSADVHRSLTFVVEED
jgi:hypothetical protein